MIGKPNYSEGGSMRKTFKLVDGDNIYRILPPFGKLAEKGQWKFFDKAHWGYGVLSDDKSKVYQKPFRCVERVEWKDRRPIIVQPCDACFKSKGLRDQYDSTKKKLEVQGETPDNMKQILEPLFAAVMRFNTDSKWWMNVENQAGEFGKLGIPHKMQLALKEAIKEFMAKCHKDPIDVSEGVFFNFKRVKHGAARDTQHVVVPVLGVRKIPDPENPTQVLEVPVYKPAPLTDEKVARMEKECWELSEMFPTLTPNDVRRMVEADADPETVAAVFGAAAPARQSAPAVQPEVKSEPKPEPKVEPPAPKVEEVKSEEDAELAALQARMAAIQAKKVAAEAVAKATPVVAKEKAPAPPVLDLPEDTDGLSDEDFATLVAGTGKSKG